MDIWSAILLGAIQGVTEFLPISSSGHLLIVQRWINPAAANDLAFDVALHLGTLVAIVAFFYRDFAQIFAQLRMSFRNRTFLSPEVRLPWLLLLGTIPAVLVGGIAGDAIEKELREPGVVVVMLVIVGVAMIAVERWARASRTISDLGFRDALTIGLAQAVALVPGTSRSGITIITGMAGKLKRADAARFSFLLSVPALLAAGAKKTWDVWTSGVALEPAPLLIGIAVAGLIGFLSLKFLIRFLSSHSLTVFAWYRFGLAAVIALTLFV